MPKSLTVTPTFSPYTFDEILKPLDMYKKTYDETQEKLDKIADDAGALQYIADSLSEDNPLKVSYNNYIQSMQRAADGMSRGLSMDVVKTASDLRRQYSAVLTPLNQARETLNAWQKEQRTAREKDDSVIFNHDVNDANILDFITRNPNASYQSASGDKVRARVATAVVGLQNQYRSAIMGGTAPEWAETAEGRLLSKDLSRGLTMEDVATIAANPDQFPELKRILDEAYASSGIDGWGTNDQKDYIRQAAFTGLMGGIGKSDEETVKNPDYLDAATKQNNSHFWANYYAALGYKPDGKTPLTVNQAGIPTMSGRSSGSSSSSSSFSGSRGQQRRQYLGVIHFDGDGTQANYGSDKEYSDAKGKSGTIVMTSDQMSTDNQARMATVLGFDRAENPDVVLEYARNNGISIMVRGKNQNGKQELIIRDTKSQVSSAQNASAGDGGGFNEDLI